MNQQAATMATECRVSATVLHCTYDNEESHMHPLDKE
jgi:hypothetical protein